MHRLIRSLPSALFFAYSRPFCLSIPHNLHNIKLYAMSQSHLFECGRIQKDEGWFEKEREEEKGAGWKIATKSISS